MNMKKFFSNIRLELEKIVWPTDKEMKTSAIQVFVFMLVLSLFFWGIDALIVRGIIEVTGANPGIETVIPPEGEDFLEYFDLDELDELLLDEIDDNGLEESNTEQDDE